MLARQLIAIGTLSACLVGTLPLLAGDDSAAKAKIKVDFQTDVAPILRQHCIDCHGPTMQLADLRLDERKYAMAEGEDRGLIKPGKSADSLLIQRLVDKKLGLIMPPTFPFFPEDKVGLPDAQIQTLKQWIDEGAAWPEQISLGTVEQAIDIKAKALFSAIRTGERENIEILLGDGSSSLINTTDRHGATPLMHAVLYANTALVRRFIDQGADVNAADHLGATALMWAAGDLGKTQLLVERGAKVDVRSKFGRTPLLIACTYADNVEVVRFLLKSRAKVTDRDMFGETPLTSASKRGAVKLVEELITAGADVHSGGGFVGRSPLAWAAEEGNVETLECLLKHGAAKDPKNLNTALFNSTVRGPVAAVRLLLEYGADVNVASGFAGYTPLLGAAYSETVNTEAVQLLLKRGANVQAKAATGDTPLKLARKRGPTEIVAALEKKDTTPRDPSPVSPGPAVAPVEARVAAEKGIALLQKCGPEFFRKSGCVACHQQSVTSLVLAEARLRGFRVDEQTAREQVHVTAVTMKSYRDKFLQRVDHPANSAIASGYVLLGLAAEKYPADEYTDANVIEMANRQATDGSWTAYGHRPPLEYSRVTATALAIRAIQLYGPPALKESLQQRIELGRKWLIAAVPASNTDHAFRLLGLAWSGADKELIQAETAKLLEQQRADGGWSQLSELGSDAYATGLTLYALHQAGGLATSHGSYRRGVEYLLKTQFPDGSWHVVSRSFPFQAYFESGFPHGPDQWISASATGFATLALIDAIPH